MGATGALSVGAISSIGNAYSESLARKTQGIYQEGIHNTNAAMAEFQAVDSIERGEFVAKEILRKSYNDLAAVRRKGKQVAGTQRATFASQGIEVSSGSAADILAETRFLQELDEIDIKAAAEIDALTVKNNAWLEAWGFKAQARTDTAQGRISRIAANNAARNTLITGGIQSLTFGLQAFGSFRKNRPSKTKSSKRKR